MDKSDIRFVLDLSLRQISLNSIFRPVYERKILLSHFDITASFVFLGI